MKQAILTFIATQIMVDGEKNDLLETFKALDTDGNGVLSKEELTLGFVDAYGFNREDAEIEVKKIMKQIDSNENEEIDFVEFVVAATNEDKLASKKKIEQAFMMFDLVGNPSCLVHLCLG